MKVVWSWLRELVDLDLDVKVQEVAERLAAAGLAVDALERVANGAPELRVVRVAEVRLHPAAEKLRLAKIEGHHGGAAPIEVVCGAPNCAPGALAVYAPPGTALPGGAVVEAAEIRGVRSPGMLLSERELGLSDDHEGILVLDVARDGGRPGGRFAEVLPAADWVLELDVTANRPDWLSHLGVAREIAALTGAALRAPEAPAQLAAGRHAGAVAITVEDAEGCPRYTGYVLDGVKMGRAPLKLRRRLGLCGVRAISNVVDVTNYVNLELGHPQHAFDLDALDREAGGTGKGEIRVRRARGGEKLTTLDGVERALAEEDLVIAGARAPLALAGVMGGADAEVAAGTTRLLLETATFDPVAVRRTSKRHGLRTESSLRFERGVDALGVARAADRTAALLAELAGASVRDARDVFAAPPAARRVGLRAARANAVLGTALPAEKMAKHLEALGCSVEAAQEQRDDAAGRVPLPPSDTWKRARDATAHGLTAWPDGGGAAMAVQVPSWRPDLTREIDLVEEVARLEGYGAVPETPERPDLSARAPWPVRAPVDLFAALRGALRGLGYHEVVTHGFVSEAALATLTEDGTAPPAEVLRVQNPLSAEQALMRTSLLPGLLRCARENLKNADGAWLFEVGRVFAPAAPDSHDEHGRPRPSRERLCVAAVAAGARDGAGLGAAPADFLDAKGAMDELLDALRVRRVAVQRARAPYFAAAAAGEIVSHVAAGKVDTAVARYGALAPALLERWDIGQRAFAVELFPLEAVLLGSTRPAMRPFARFPGSTRDVALLLDDAVASAKVLELLGAAAEPLLVEARVFDEYRGAELPPGKKSLAYRLRYAAADRTLTREEVDRAHGALVDHVRAALGAQVR
ncbi:MAG TPA: phenylalanine--tRNA ligase subunit beta [Myxococcota bacterium]|jgi:phenylalanyl-tRNA synthetase beta chain|nr:phenylalanine--tRNA ligase subunit beta [Myxococcota bacterium]